MSIADDVPTELWLYILGNLDYHDLKRCQRVNRRLRTMTLYRTLDAAMFRPRAGNSSSAPLSLQYSSTFSRPASYAMYFPRQLPRSPTFNRHPALTKVSFPDAELDRCGTTSAVFNGRPGLFPMVVEPIAVRVEIRGVPAVQYCYRGLITTAPFPHAVRDAFDDVPAAFVGQLGLPAAIFDVESASSPPSCHLHITYGNKFFVTQLCLRRFAARPDGHDLGRLPSERGCSRHAWDYGCADDDDGVILAGHVVNAVRWSMQNGAVSWQLHSQGTFATYAAQRGGIHEILAVVSGDDDYTNDRIQDYLVIYPGSDGNPRDDVQGADGA